MEIFISSFVDTVHILFLKLILIIIETEKKGENIQKLLVKPFSMAV